MRLGTLKNGQTVAVDDKRVLPLEQIGWNHSLLKFIEADDDTQRDIRERLMRIPTHEWQLMERKQWAAPITRPHKIVAIGLNYKDHAEETGKEVPTEPLVFSKFPTSVVGPHDIIEMRSSISTKIDFEVELAVVFGKKARKVPEHRALEHVFGYTVANDVTARDLQKRDGQWTRAKGMDTFCPMGPWIVTRDEIREPNALGLGCAVNDVVMQNSNTANMIFQIPALIARISAWCTFEPGDVMITGTPSGVGFARNPAVFLKPGDVVRAWVDGIGELKNKVAEASSAEADGR